MVSMNIHRGMDKCWGGLVIVVEEILEIGRIVPMLSCFDPADDLLQVVRNMRQTGALWHRLLESGVWISFKIELWKNKMRKEVCLFASSFTDNFKVHYLGIGCSSRQLLDRSVKKRSENVLNKSSDSSTPTFG
jgi:hypothetical protein